jgi:hypothetical protein
VGCGSAVAADLASGPIPGENDAMRKFLRYITNNENRSRHEEAFDGIFWITETVALVFGVCMLLSKHNAEWIPFLVIEYCWAMDNLRHNRP